MTSSNAKTLALMGGPQACPIKPKRYNPIGREEIAAVTAVLESGVLSQFLGTWSDDFYGGPRVKEFERAWEAWFGVTHAVSVNSCTSGLIAALGAIGIEPGDEVIVSPWTMCASATAILHWNAIPVFADIEADTFCIDPSSVEANITEHTRAIVAIDIFGHPANMAELSRIAKQHNLKLISDSAQAPGALYRNHYAGTMSDIGVFSLNYHKHIHTGEGGVAVTADDTLAERMRLIRNHAEAVVGDMGHTDLRNMIGHNFRLGEIEAALGIQQLKKLGKLVAGKQASAQRLSAGLQGLRGLRTPVVAPDCTHIYYLYPLVIDAELGVDRGKIARALAAEGVEGISEGYVNVHRLPIYQEKIAYGSKGFPWSSEHCRREVDYRKGICPTAEQLHDSTCLTYSMCMYDLDEQVSDGIIEAFHKVWRRLEDLNDLPSE